MIIGFNELLIIVLATLIIFKPKEYPKLFKLTLKGVQKLKNTCQKWKSWTQDILNDQSK